MMTRIIPSPTTGAHFFSVFPSSAGVVEEEAASPCEKTNEPTPTSIFPSSSARKFVGITQGGTHETRPPVLCLSEFARKDREVNSEYRDRRHQHHMRPPRRQERSVPRFLCGLRCGFRRDILCDPEEEGDGEEEDVVFDRMGGKGCLTEQEGEKGGQVVFDW